MGTIDSILSTADRAWRVYGVAAADRRRLAADLRPDLEQAVADGVDPARLLGGDVGEFARRLADEAGLRHTAPEYGRFLTATLVGAVLGVVVMAAVMSGLYTVFVAWFDLPRGLRIPVLVPFILFCGVPAAAALVGAIIGVRRHLRETPRVRETARLMSAFLPLAAVVITPVTVLFAWSTDYSLAPVVVLTEMALPLAALAAAVVAARVVALRADEPLTPALTEA